MLLREELDSEFLPYIWLLFLIILDVLDAILDLLRQSNVGDILAEGDLQISSIIGEIECNLSDGWTLHGNDV
jgi:hypothetical protein